MGVFLRRTKSGIYPLWMGFYQADGKRHEHTLCPWKGTPPAPGEEKGDEAFEKSRERAEAIFKRWRAKGKSDEEEVALVQRVHALRYGGKVERVEIDDLAAKWDALPHKADLTDGRRARVHSVLKTFRDFMADKFPKVKEAGALTAEHFKAFLAAVDARGVSARSWNDYLSILRGVLAKVDGQSKGFREYLSRLPKRPEKTVHRRPFAGDELEGIYNAAAETDPELYPVLVAAACTALRRGDVCGLKWEDIDLAEGFVTVKTSKTGETVDIPIFPPFRAVLEKAAKTRKKGVPYVWPEIALAYARNPDGLNWRLGKVLTAAGFATPEKVEGAKYPAPPSPGEAVAMVDAAIRKAKWTEARRQKGLMILKKHLEGKDAKTIAGEMKVSKAAVPTFLREMEDAAKVAIVSPPKPETPDRATLAEVRVGEQRKQRGSLCGWHSFRTTFCTLALANGVPMELLRKITGHRTAEIVLRHYDRRGREAMKKAFGEAMPRAIVGAVGAALPAKSGADAGDALEGECVEVADAKAKRSPAAALADLLKGATDEEVEAVREFLLARRAAK